MVHGYISIVDDVECVCAFDALGSFSGAGTDSLAETSEFIRVRYGLRWS